MKITITATEKEKKNCRRGFIGIAGLLILVLIFGQMVFASSGGVKREAHKVEAGDKSYCFFVPNDVVITPGDVSGLPNDKELTESILRRAGLYIVETNCKDPKNSAIGIDEWLEEGNGVMFSEEDLVAIRGASPSDGKPVKLHMDLLFTLKVDKDAADNDDDTGDDSGNDPGTDPGNDPGGDPGDNPGGDPGTDPGDNPGGDPGTDPGDNPGGDPGTDPGDNPGGNPGTDPGDNPGGDPGTDPGDNPGGDPGTDPGNNPGGDPGTDPGDNPGGDPGTDPGNNPGGDPGTDPGNNPGGDPGTDPGNEQEEEQPVYSTFKLTSPELVFVVIATEKDSKVTEEECEYQEQEQEHKPVGPVIPDEPDINLPDLPGETLPEFRTINMVNKGGKALTPVLEDGEPVTLTWIEPNNTIDTEAAKDLIGRFPGGLAGIGGLLALIGAAICFLVLYRKKKKEDEDW